MYIWIHNTARYIQTFINSSLPPYQDSSNYYIKKSGNPKLILIHQTNNEWLIMVDGSI